MWILDTELDREQAASFRAGVVGVTSLMFGMMPWAVVVGVAMVSAGLSGTQAILMNLLVFAGSAQLAVLPLFMAKAPLWVMFVTALVVNVRYVIYSAVLAPRFARLSWRWRAFLSYLIVDGVFALFIARVRPDDQRHSHWFYLGGSLTMWTMWQAATAVGVFGGAMIPRSWSLEFAGTLALIALLIPLLFDRAVVCGAVAAGAVSLVAARLPMNLGVVASVGAGVLVGLTVSSLWPRRQAGSDGRAQGAAGIGRA